MIYWSMAAARQLLQKGSRVTQQSPSCGFLCWGRNALIDSRGSLHLSITPSAASPSQSLSILPLRLSCALQQGEAEGRVSATFSATSLGSPLQCLRWTQWTFPAFLACGQQQQTGPEEHLSHVKALWSLHHQPLGPSPRALLKNKMAGAPQERAHRPVGRRARDPKGLQDFRLWLTHSISVIPPPMFMQIFNYCQLHS